MTYLLLVITYSEQFFSRQQNIQIKKAPHKKELWCAYRACQNCHYKAEEEEKEAKIFEENKNPNCFFTFFLL